MWNLRIIKESNEKNSQQLINGNIEMNQIRISQKYY